MSAKFTLLWTDDDGAERFSHERYLIERSGAWEIVWALDVCSSMEALRKQRFHAIILDQMLPCSGPSAARVTPNSVEVWGGCILLYWLRKGMYPPVLPQGARSSIPDFAAGPLPTNVAAPLLILSAFHDDKVASALQNVDPSLAVLPKPIDEVQLLAFIQSVESGRHGSD